MLYIMSYVRTFIGPYILGSTKVLLVHHTIYLPEGYLLLKTINNRVFTREYIPGGIF